MQCSFRVVRQKLDTTPPIKVNNSVGTPSLNDLKSSDNTKNMSYDVDVQLVAIKAYFMNEIYELKREISQLKCQEKSNLYFARTKFFYKIRDATKTINY